MEDEKDNKQKMVEPTADAFVDSSISITIDSEKYYYLYVDMDAEHSFEFRNSFRINGLGSVTELIDEDENVVNRYRYTPFGEPIVKIAGVFNPYQYTFRNFSEIPNVNGIAEQFRQTGRRFDNETGQYYYRARMYSPQQGRFLSNDPMGMVDGPNMYMYVRNDPVNFRDPSGRWNPGWGDPMLINGWGGGGDNWDDCPDDWYFKSFDECRMYWSFDECMDFCFDYEEEPDPWTDEYDNLPDEPGYWACVSMEISLWCAEWSFWCFTICPSFIYVCLLDPSKVTCVPALICLGLPAIYGLTMCL